MLAPPSMPSALATWHSSYAIASYYILVVASSTDLCHCQLLGIVAANDLTSVTCESLSA